MYYEEHFKYVILLARQIIPTTPEMEFIHYMVID